MYFTPKKFYKIDFCCSLCSDLVAEAIVFKFVSFVTSRKYTEGDLLDTLYNGVSKITI